MKPVRFHDEARAEIAYEALYDNAVSKALAERFLEDKYGTRRYFPGRFPFSIVYLERRDEIYVLALAPFARKPGYWRGRRAGAT